MKLLIVDAMNLIRRIYAAAEDAELPLEATRSRCLAAIARNAEQSQATHVAMVFEQKCITWRHQLWPDYKLGRPPMPQPLQDDLEALQRYFRQCGLYCLELSGWEGDDVVASLAVKAAFAGLQVTILSTDKGFCQLVNPRLTVRNHFDRFSWDEAMVEQKFGLKPAQLCDFWALTGDTTNHLPGVPGIGPKNRRPFTGYPWLSGCTAGALSTMRNPGSERAATALAKRLADPGTGSFTHRCTAGF